MNDMVKVVKAAKIVDSLTFQPKIRCIIDIDIEPMKETGVIYKDGYIEKKFYNEFVTKVAKAFEQYKEEPCCIYIYPDQLDITNERGDVEFLSFPQKWVYMNQMLKPCVSVSGQHLDAKTFKMDGVWAGGRPDFMDNTHKLRDIVVEAQEFLEKNNAEFFYYIILQRVTNPKTLDSEYTMMVRGV